MTWHIWILLSIIAGTLEELIDKIVLVKRPENIDPVVASFFRNLCFFVFTVLAGLWGIFGEMHFIFTTSLLVLALLWPLNSLSYDYFLRHVELSRFNGFFYAFPFIFVIIDILFFHQSYSLMQMLGVLLIVIGSIVFSFDHAQKRFVVTWQGTFWLLVKMAAYVYMAVLFKQMSDFTNEISFYFSAWTLVIAVYGIILFVTGRYRHIPLTARTNGFLKSTFISKGFDFLSGIFYFKAIALASLATVSTASALSPLVLLMLLMGVSLFTKVDIEDFSKETAGLKIVATVALVAGGILFLM